MASRVNLAARAFGGTLAVGLLGYGCGGESATHSTGSGGTGVYDIATCDDTGPPDAATPAPPKGPCPNVRARCSTLVGCCESIATLIAGPAVDPGAPANCCYLAQPGFGAR